jgi:hypothetical protein
MAGTSSRPSSVKEYSTEGGEVGRTWREITPFSSISRRRAVRTLAEMPGMSSFSSLKRRGPLLRYQTTFGAQAPPISPMHSVSAQVSGSSRIAARVRVLQTGILS